MPATRSSRRRGEHERELLFGIFCRACWQSVDTSAVSLLFPLFLSLSLSLFRVALPDRQTHSCRLFGSLPVLLKLMSSRNEYEVDGFRVVRFKTLLKEGGQKRASNDNGSRGIPAEATSTGKQEPRLQDQQLTHRKKPASGGGREGENGADDVIKAQRDDKTDKEIVWEFGGPWGTFAIIAFSHVLMLWLWISLEHYSGRVPLPESMDDVVPFAYRMVEYVRTGAMPTWLSIKIFWGFMIFQAVLAMTMPGVVVCGLPVPSENFVKHPYLCNGYASWLVTLAAVGLGHYSGYFRLSIIVEQLGPLATTAMLSGDLIALVTYLGAFVARKTHRMSGNHIYDYFMGAWLNPRIGHFDLKMWTEIRVAWITLAMLTLSAAVAQYEKLGYVSTPMWFMLLAHFLYTNACVKGEECVATTWDIFYEKWGWMLIFWNFAGVPFVYCFNSMFVLANFPNYYVPQWLQYGLFLIVLCAYYVWDTANAQKNRLRMMRNGSYLPRHTFPQLPWATLHNPRVLVTPKGELLVDGWYGYARKIHYTADVVMGLCWGMNCGFTHLLPYFYVAFFSGMIFHRNVRDQERCAIKYGKAWDAYLKIVKYAFIPGVY